jgi:class 3 adenylate cyclase
LKNGKYNVALKHHFKALSITDKLGEKLDKMRTLKGIANVLVEQNEYKAAIDRYQQAKALGEELGANVELKALYQDMSVAYTRVSDYRNAFLYKTKYADIKDTLYNDETIKKIGRLQFDFDLYKKEGEITLLTKDKALKEAQLKRQEFARNTLVGGLGIAMMITGLLYRNYRVKVKTNRLLDKQKDEIEGLLLNILPAEVAKELQVTGNSVPKDYESVSVMFTDFKGFTAHADKMSPQELVEELNACFVEFDNIIAKHNLEKIKTIGDSYMCAGGIPTPNDEHPFNIVEAALEIQEYMSRHNRKRAEAGLPTWEARIGIHVGPVVAGVVGKKKYAYDIWGNTVNIASRMESNGEAGQVNISAALYSLIKDKYNCAHRGKINAKNVGDIDMYFVEPSAKVVPIEKPNINITQTG